MNHMIDLSEIQTYEARNGDVLTGTAGEDIHLFIAPGATITLNGVTLACMNAQNRWAAITCLGDARIVLEGVNIVRCGNEHFPGILPAEGKTLTLGGTGSLSIGCNGWGAGIGGGKSGDGADVTINGGIVNAWGGYSGAGIGTGENLDDGIDYTGKLTVNGGEVYAYGGNDAAGIGGGWNASGSDVTVNGGYVYAKGDGNGAGIGSGSEDSFSGGRIGGKLTVTGGHVEAYGGVDAAGIGGGEDADGGTVAISGGYVYAKGSYGGAGIGGGEGGDGANVTITGGTVHASAGSGDTGNRAIGPGYGDDVYGSLTIGDLMMVRSERIFTEPERVNGCWYRTDVHVEPCTHPGYTADTCPYHKH